MNIRRTGLRVLAALALMGTTTIAATQTYPSRPIRIIVPMGAGGVSDINARLLAQKMSESLHQQVVVENLPSAGGIIASEKVAKAEPDGYTLLLVSNANAISASLFKSLPYDTVNDFAPIATFAFFDLVMLVNRDARFRNVADLITEARADPAKFNIGSISIGTTPHLSAELFRSMAGITAPVVPFKTTGDMLTAVRGNDIQVAFDGLPAAMTLAKSGMLKILALSSDQRFPSLPDVPTVGESGLPGYHTSSWAALSAPAKTPRAIIERLNKEVRAAVASPDVRQRFQDLGVTARSSTPEEFRELLVSEIAKWRGVIETAKIEKR